MPRLVLVPVAVGAALCCLAAAPQKSNPALEVAFNNTVVSTYPDGRHAELWLNRDGTYKAMGRRKDLSDGHWSLKGGKVCLRQSHPLAVPFSYCTPLRAGGVGTSWAAKAVTGEAVKVKIVAGRTGG
jgi:hypothetical protein